MRSVLPVPGVEILISGAFVTPVPTVSTLSGNRPKWDGVELESFECVPGCSVHEHQHPVHFITLQTSGHIRTAWNSGGRSRTERQSPGTICVLPRGSLHRHEWSDTSSRVIVTLEPAFLARATDETAHRQDVELQERWDLRDPHIAALLLALHADVKDGQPAGVLYGETLATALAVYLTRRLAVTRVKSAPLRGGLAGYRLRRVVDHIDENLGGDLRLAALASVAGMSPHHFAELFRKSVGDSPHRYVLRRRIERAKQLLRASNASIADIALAAGFVDQSHFSKVFRKIAGSSPRGWREQP
jgi:AraC family transcriptional regulator